MTDKNVKVNIECGFELKSCEECERIDRHDYYLGVDYAIRKYSSLKGLPIDEKELDKFMNDFKKEDICENVLELEVQE